MSRRLPGPRGLRWLRACWALKRDPYLGVHRLIAKHGDLFRLRLGRSSEVIVVSAPELAEEVLLRQASSFRRSSSYRELRSLLGDGLLSAEGERWRTHRRLIQPAFQRGAAEALGPLIEGRVAAATTKWGARGGLNVQQALLELTLEIAVSALLGIEATPAELRELLNAMMVPMGIRPTDSRRWLPWVRVDGRAEAAATLRRLAAIFIRRRLELGAQGADLLGQLLGAEEAGALTREDVVDEVLNFLAAGHETSAYALTWTLYLVAQRPELQERLVVDEGELTQRVLQESMRLYPPVWAIERETERSVELGGFEVPAGRTLVVSVSGIHRHASQWRTPEIFDPDRFLPAASKARHASAYLPFGRGRRQCIGEDLAFHEMRIVLEAVVRSFHLSLDESVPVVPKGGVTLRPRDGLWLRLRARG